MVLWSVAAFASLGLSLEGKGLSDDDSYVPVMVFSMIQMLCLQSVFVTVYQSHPPLFPTLFSARSMGISNIVARLVTILAPIVAEIDYPVPTIIILILSVVAGVCSSFIISASSFEKQKQ